MKLLTKINRTYLKFGVIVFFVADLLLILTIRYIENKEMINELKIGANEVCKVIEAHGDIPDINPRYSSRKIDLQLIVEPSLKDTVLFDPEDGSYEEFREYSFSKVINGQNYLVIHRHDIIQFSDIFFMLTTAISVVLFLIFIALLIYTRTISSKLWQSFNENIERLKSFSFSSPTKLDLASTGISEFDDLNQVISKMSGRLESDYQASREFSAHAAHELQTPLAIIRNKCEDLFSNQDLDDKTIQSLREIYVSTDRLSGVTKALLLLAKIDHGQFNEDDQVSISEIVREKLALYQDILEDRKLTVNLLLEQDCVVNMDIRLVNLWIQNILINAIKHSSVEREIEIKLKSDQLAISNYGQQAIKNPDAIFNSFYKETQQNGSTGIGLAIVKKITDYYNVKIEYSFNDFKHTFTFQL